jgi:tripartite-type tricarboxylate transporter receptor subunit TctC
MDATSNTRRRLLQASMASALPAMPAFAQSPGDYPHKPLTVVVPYSPGGGVDIVARLVAEPMSRELGKAVIIENRAGVSGIVGSQYASRAPADGYTLLAGNLTTNVMNALLLPTAGYTPEQFAPVAVLNSFPEILVVNLDSRFRSVSDIVDACKREPDSLTYGSSGVGSAQHLAAELFQHAAGIRMRHVPYKGSPAVMNDLLGGQIDLSFEVPTVSGPLVHGGKLRALGVTSLKPLASHPDVRPIADQGWPGYEMVFWDAMFAPAATPRPIVDRLAAILARATATPEFVARMNELGAFAGTLQTDAMLTFQNSERRKWSELVTAMNIHID